MIVKQIQIILLLILGSFYFSYGQTGIHDAMDAKEIKKGLKSHDKALFLLNDWIRDPYITLGPDDYYYLTGTTPNPGDKREQTDPYNTGLGKTSLVGYQMKVWRSKDLIKWEYIGTPYDHTKGLQYGKNPEKLYNNKTIRECPLWAPELHSLGDKWALVNCPKFLSNLMISDGLELNESTKWTSAAGEQFWGKHDPSLFQDTDGSWYALWGNTFVAQMSDDLSEIIETPVRIDPAGERPDPNKPDKMMKQIGHEGATMAKIGDKYVHFGTAWSTDLMRKGSYNLYYSLADSIHGPYGPRRFVGRFLGHGTPFQTRNGDWWCTAFYNANIPPISTEGIQDRDLSETAQTINRRGTTIVPLEVVVQEDGDVYIRAKAPGYANPGPDEHQKF